MRDDLESDPNQAIYVDPQMGPIIEQMITRMAEREPFGTVSPEVMRRRFNEDTAAWNENPPALPRVVDGTIDGAAGALRYRLYDPVGNGAALPCLLHFHGGGWIVGDYATNDRTLRLLAKISGVAVLSADYRLAPEHKFPAGLDDCVAVSRTVHERANDLGIDPERIGISGDSAGGNLALAAALKLRDEGEDWLKFLLLVYPALCPKGDSGSHRIFGQGEFGLGTQAMEFFWSLYLREAGERNNPLAAPLLANLDGLPYTQIVSGGLDALQDDAYRLEQLLAKARVPHEHRMYPGVVHGFFSMTNFLDVANVAVEEAAAVIAQQLGVSELPAGRG